LVVAADEGAMPQTLQHIEILSLIGVTRIFLVITKIDVVDEGKVHLRASQMSELIKQHDLELMAVAPVSCVADRGFSQLKETLVQVLSKIPSRTYSSLRELPVYLPVDRAFNIVGHGLVVTGTLVRGTIRQEDSVWVEPMGAKARIRALETFGNSI